MATNPKDNFICKAMVPYIDNIDDCHLQTVVTVECVEVQELLEKKVLRRIKENQKTVYFLQECNSTYETQIQLNERKKESLIAALNKPTIEELQKQLLNAKEKTRLKIENGNIKLKKYAEQWVTNKSNFESIHFVKKYFEVTNKIETKKENIKSFINHSKQLTIDIDSKKDELFNKDKKLIIKLAEYMINKRPVILKLINEILNERRQLKNNKRLVITNELLRSNLTEVTIEPKNMPVHDMKNVFDKNKAHDNLVLPKLQLQDDDNMSFFPIEYGQKDNFKSATPKAAPVRRSTIYPTLKFDFGKDHVSKYFNSPTKIGVTKKYSDKKLINILEEKTLDTMATYKIISKVNPHQLQDVNVIEAGQSQHDLKDNKSQATINGQENDEEIEIIDLTKKKSQDIILLPPTQFLDLSQIPQEKRVTFNSVVTVNNSPNVMIEDTKTQDDDNMTVTLNHSIASDDSYKKIENFVFQKRNFNLSPEFTYNKNTMAPKMPDKIVTSVFFDEKEIADGDKMEMDNTEKQMEVVQIDDNDLDKNKPDNDTVETIAEVTKPANASDILLQAQECPQKDVEPSASFRSYMQRLGGALNISLNTTGCEEDDGDFTQCTFDSSLLLSPKAEDEMQIDNNSEVQSQEMPSFLSGLRKTGISFFGNTSVNKLESGQQNSNKNFNFTFGDDKIKKGSLFNMFR